MRLEMERAKYQADADLQRKRMEFEQEQARARQRAEALRNLAAVLEGPGSPAEKKRSFTALLNFYIDLNIFPKETGSKLMELATEGVKTLGILLGLLKSDVHDTASACCQQCCSPCRPFPPVVKPPSKPKPPAKCG
jgi:hypothetical protein